ncbi:MAG: hypothetical protein WB392_02460 [Methanotrichaceae archaeon]
MVKKERLLLLIIMLIILVLPIADAAVDFTDLRGSVDRYNNNIDKAPDLLKAMMGNERINMTILLSNGSVIAWGLVTENAKIVKYNLGGIDNPTIDEYASENAINDVLTAKDSAAAFNKAKDAGLIRIEGKTPIAKLKIAAMLSSGDAIKYYFGMFS